MTRCSLTAQQLDVVYAAGQAGCGTYGSKLQVCYELRRICKAGVGLGIVPGTLFDLYGPVETSLYGSSPG